MGARVRAKWYGVAGSEVRGAIVGLIYRSGYWGLESLSDDLAATRKPQGLSRIQPDLPPSTAVSTTTTVYSARALVDTPPVEPRLCGIPYRQPES